MEYAKYDVVNVVSSALVSTSIEVDSQTDFVDKYRVLQTGGRVQRV